MEPLRTTPEEPRSDGYWGWEKYEYFRDHNHVFSALTGMSFDNLASVRAGSSDPEDLVLGNVLGNYFQVLGLKHAIGRLIGPEDGQSPEPISAGDPEVNIAAPSRAAGPRTPHPAAMRGES